ncbi:MAG: helix-turn-helix transcriptional regulator [Desulfobacterales bacterium]|nr:helix-turn-helix transcriptional regulator [Desulfobacterales bacterium]
MQVVVKRPHIRVEGEISSDLIEYLRKHYDDVEVIENEDDELIEVTKSSWYKDIRAKITPGENMRVYRRLHNLTQEELGKKLGRFTRQNISNMERGHRGISKSVAKRLAELFDVSVEKFL